jgi:hypothetical protein
MQRFGHGWRGRATVRGERWKAPGIQRRGEGGGQRFGYGWGVEGGECGGGAERAGNKAEHGPGLLRLHAVLSRRCEGTRHDLCHRLGRAAGQGRSIILLLRLVDIDLWQKDQPPPIPPNPPRPLSLSSPPPHTCTHPALHPLRYRPSTWKT